MNRIIERNNGSQAAEMPSEKMATVIMRPEEEHLRQPQPWSGLDLSAMGIPHVGPSLCRLSFITHLYLSRNDIEYLPPQLAHMEKLEVLDVSYNKLREIPAEIGSIKTLKELLLYHNHLTNLPFELGRLYRLRVLGLVGNPLSEPLLTYSENTESVLTYLLESGPVTPPPPDRVWVYPSNVDTTRYKLTSNTVTVFCYNILCEKYASRNIFKYCPQWALAWEHRRGIILKEMLNLMSDIVCLQEVEFNQYFQYFLPEMQARGYGGLFKPKSRARTMNQETVDGCAIFFHTGKYRQKEEHLIEFERLSTRYSSGCAAMLNRVMPKDNIALCALLENIKTNELLFVCNLHLTWDPAFKDVKVIQTALTLTEIEAFLKDRNLLDVPMLVMGDFNSMHDSGVYELMDNGRLSKDHNDFAGYDYAKFFETVGLKHGLRLKSAYSNEMPYSNYTVQFKGTVSNTWYQQLYWGPSMKRI